MSNALSSRLWWLVWSISILSSMVPMTGCKRPQSSAQGSNSPAATAAASAETVDRKTAEPEAASLGEAEKAKYVGSWEFEVGMSVDQTISANEGKVNLLVDLRQAIQQSFNQMELSIEVSNDGTFICRQKTGLEEGEFRGTWTVDGDQVTFLQTHRGDVVEEDSMTGKISGTWLELNHLQGDFTARYVLYRKE